MSVESEEFNIRQMVLVLVLIALISLPGSETLVPTTRCAVW